MYRFISNGKDNKCRYPNSICHYKQASAHYRDNVFTLRCFQSHCNTAAMQSTCRNIAERMVTSQDCNISLFYHPL